MHAHSQDDLWREFNDRMRRRAHRRWGSMHGRGWACRQASEAGETRGSHTHEDVAPSAAAELAETVERMSRILTTLSDRVAVLERLMVDDEARLAAEIERLRKTSND